MIITHTNTLCGCKLLWGTGGFKSYHYGLLQVVVMAVIKAVVLYRSEIELKMLCRACIAI
jgi:hypothetical protein